jgi:hypothetical protein
VQICGAVDIVGYVGRGALGTQAEEGDGEESREHYRLERWVGGHKGRRPSSCIYEHWRAVADETHSVRPSALWRKAEIQSRTTAEYLDLQRKKGPSANFTGADIGALSHVLCILYWLELRRAYERYGHNGRNKSKSPY